MRREISHWTLAKDIATTRDGEASIPTNRQTTETYLRHTSHRAGGELVDEGKGSLRLVGHDERPG